MLNSTFLDPLANQMALSYPCSFHPLLCILVRLNILKKLAGARFTPFNVSPCTSSPCYLDYNTGKLQTLVDIIFSPEAAWMESSSLVSFKLTNPVLCVVVSHVTQCMQIMMLVSNSYLVLSGDILFGIISIIISLHRV